MHATTLRWEFSRFFHPLLLLFKFRGDFHSWDILSFYGWCNKVKSLQANIQHLQQQQQSKWMFLNLNEIAKRCSRLAEVLREQNGEKLQKGIGRK